MSGNSNEMQRILNSIPNATKKEFSFFYHMLSEVSSEDPDTEKLGMFTPEEASALNSKTSPAKISPLNNKYPVYVAWEQVLNASD